MRQDSGPFCWCWPFWLFCRPEDFPSDLMTGSGAILLVDDEDMIGEIGARMLEALGFEVQVTGGGKEAIALYEADPNRFRMVILAKSKKFYSVSAQKKRPGFSTHSAPIRVRCALIRRRSNNGTTE